MPRVLPPLEGVGVESQDHQAVEGLHTLAAGLGPRLVGFVTAEDVKMGSVHLVAQGSGVGDDVDVATSQPAQLASAKARPGHEHHEEAVPGRAAGYEQRHDVEASLLDPAKTGR